MAAALLSFREGLEAALIVGIVLGYLARTGQRASMRAAWAGVAAAILVSVVVGAGLFAVGVELEGRAEEIFEGATMILAACVLTWMIFWMQRQGSQLRHSLESALQATSGWGVFSLAFLAVVREGIELALFLTAALFASSAASTLVGSVAGLAAAVAVGVLVYAGSRRLNVQRFFAISSVFLIIVAAGLVAHGVHEFNEAGIVPAIVEHVWSTKSVLSDSSTAGSLLKAVFGYNDDPSLTEVIAYIVYAVAVGSAALLRSRQAERSAAPSVV